MVRRRSIWFALFFIYLLILISIIFGAYNGLIPTKLRYIPFYDFIGHFFLLGILSYLLHRSLDRKYFLIRGLKIPLAPVLVTVLALVEEFTQLFSSIRTFSLLDALANMVGIWIFYILDRWSSNKDRVVGKKKKIIIIGAILPFVVAGGIYVSTIIFPNFGYAVGLMIGLASCEQKEFDFERVYNANSYKQATLLLYTDHPCSLSYYTHIYIVPGEYSKKKVPEDGNYIKLHKGSGMYFDWIDDDTLGIYIDRDSEISNFESNTVKVQIVKDEAEMDRLRQEGKHIRRYELNLDD